MVKHTVQGHRPHLGHHCQGGGADQHLSGVESSLSEASSVWNNQVWPLLFQQGCGEALGPATTQGEHSGQPLLCNCCRECFSNSGHTHRCDQSKNAEREQSQGSKDFLVPSLCGEDYRKAGGNQGFVERRPSHCSACGTCGRSTGIKLCV